MQSFSNDNPLDRAFLILEVVSVAARPVSITEIANACELPLASVHRLAGHLEARQLLKRALGSKRYIVGPAMTKLSASALAASGRSDRVHRHLESLAREIGEHCHLGICIDNEIVYCDSARSTHSAGLQFEPGTRAPLYASSIGKLFLAELPAQEFRDWLARNDRVAITERTIVSEAALKKAIGAVRKNGWATSNEELAPGVVGCAVPVRLGDGRLFAGLGISVPSARMAFETLGQFRPTMDRTAASIAAAVEEP